ncbi:oligopeptide/dipeptide ABC transporter ATP-binding protein [Streptomyces sp. NBC_01408]|uniref:oligopeptide/dipeptide ABC transporter ATP-binding protein n=1 Tax=Streptomyces sp. NBC_01408 TaxID=2903855 RepID=UPI0022554AC0|nr:oligopeptide/dipeptide ABC transporter ATP-binding protein [Streptomyces sp. NBC_01408]MCX4694646.1 ATP-binding cassette domain-containing protein [Streptomyces sp. NBC_01408]
MRGAAQGAAVGAEMAPGSPRPSTAAVGLRRAALEAAVGAGIAAGSPRLSTTAAGRLRAAAQAAAARAGTRLWFPRPRTAAGLRGAVLEAAVPAENPPGSRRPRTAAARLRAAAQAAAARTAFPATHLDRYPHELSGGLAQRAATALALVGDAPLLLADEPTTGLDRDLVHRTADELRAHTRDAGRALLMITHDLAAAERIADTVAVMYAGRIVELAPARAFFGSPGPRHPYTRGLLEALPERAFTPIPGAPPELGALPPGCAFAPRCDRADALCRAERPVLTEGPACHHA